MELLPSMINFPLSKVNCLKTAFKFTNLANIFTELLESLFSLKIKAGSENRTRIISLEG